MCLGELVVSEEPFAEAFGKKLQARVESCEGEGAESLGGRTPLNWGSCHTTPSPEDSKPSTLDPEPETLNPQP